MSDPPQAQDEIAALRAQSHQTRRATVPAMEERPYTPHPVLDHGFVRAIDYMGDDSAIVPTARIDRSLHTRSWRL